MNDKPDAMTQEAVDATSDTSVEKIREILFGGQMRDYGQRFAELEKRILSETQRLAEETTQRLESLESLMKSEIVRLDERVGREGNERRADSEAHAQRVDAMSGQLGEDLRQLGERSGNEAREIRNSLHEQVTKLVDLVRTTREELASQLVDQSRELKESKVGRGDLADLLSEVALRLNRDFNLPDAD